MPGVRGIIAQFTGLHELLEGEGYDAVAAQALAAELQPHALARQLSIAVDLNGLEPYQAEAFRRACAAAMQTWNWSLQGIVDLVPHSGANRPDFVIDAQRRPLGPGRLGETRYARWHRCGPQRPRVARILISTTERASRGALPLSPGEIFWTVCHELGHGFWLGECTRPGSLMGPCEWGIKPPPGPFLPERRSVMLLAGELYRLLATAYDRVGEPDCARDARGRLSALRSAERHEPGGRTPVNWDLLSDFAYAPPVVRRFWEGTMHVHEGRPAAALACYSELQAAALQQPEVSVRSAWVRKWSGDPTRAIQDMERAVRQDPRWMHARRSYAWMLEDSGRRDEAIRHSVVAHRMSCLANSRQWVSTAWVTKSPRRALAALGDALRRALECGASYVRPLGYRDASDSSRKRDAIRPRDGRRGRVRE